MVMAYSLALKNKKNLTLERILMNKLNVFVIKNASLFTQTISSVSRCGHFSLKKIIRENFPPY